MQFDPDMLLSQLQTLAASFGPWGLLVATGIGVYLRFFRKTPAPARPGPTPPPANPVPAPEPAPASEPARPVRDGLLKLLASIAARRFPAMPPDQAVERYIVEQANQAYYSEDLRREREARGDTPF